MSVELLVEPSDALPIVSVLVAFRSGSTHDPPGKEGLARISARMLRRGARGLSADTIEETVDALGGELAADASPSASSVQFEVIRRNLDPFADVMATVLGEPLVDEGELARLLREAEAEIVESRDNDRTLASRAFRKTLFEGHPYGRRNSGTIASVKSIRAEDVRAHFARHYARANAIVAISGDIDRDEAGALAERLLAKLPEGARVEDPTPEPKAPRGRTLVFVDKPDRTQTQMVIGGLGTDPRDRDHVPLLVANTVFGGTFSSRLMQEVRAKRGWSYGASSRVGFDRRRDAFTMWTAPSAADAPACLALELELLHQLRAEGVTEDELEFVKRYLVRSYAFEIDTARKRVHQRLETELFDMPSDYYATYLDRVREVDVRAASEAVRARLSERDLVVGVVGTWAESGAKIEAAIPDLARTIVLPFDGD